MTIKIDAWRGERYYFSDSGKEVGTTVLRTSDWRKIMAVVREADLSYPLPPTLFKAIDDLRKHLEKRK